MAQSAGLQNTPIALCRGVRLSQQVSWYDSKQSDGESPEMLEFWGIRTTPSLKSFLFLLWPGVVAPDKVLSMSEIELSCVLMLNWIISNRTDFDI